MSAEDNPNPDLSFDHEADSLMFDLQAAVEECRVFEHRQAKERGEHGSDRQGVHIWRGKLPADLQSAPQTSQTPVNT